MGLKSAQKSIISRVEWNGGSWSLNYIKRRISWDYGFPPPQGQAMLGGGGVECDEMWRYLLLCIIRSTGDYTLDPQRVDIFFPPAF